LNLYLIWLHEFPVGLCKERFLPSQYILNVLLGEALGLNVSLTKNESDLLNADGAKINYSDKKIEGAIQLIPHSILSDYGVKDYTVEVQSNARFFKLFLKQAQKKFLSIFSALLFGC